MKKEEHNDVNYNGPGVGLCHDEGNGKEYYAGHYEQVLDLRKGDIGAGQVGRESENSCNFGEF